MKLFDITHILKTQVIALTITAFLANSAQADSIPVEPPQECIKGQYVMNANVPALRLKAEVALEEISKNEFNKIEQSKDSKVILLENEYVEGNVTSNELNPEMLPPSRNLCGKLKKQRRAKILDDVKNGRTASVDERRIFDCSCNALFHTTDTLPNDPKFSELWGMNTSGPVDINAPEAWNYNTGSDSMIIGVIDTGIDYNHPDLRDNIWTNPGEIPGNGIDDDNNGYVDDIHGINAINGTGDPMDDVGHGTHCAGTIGAKGNNSIGVVGVAWNVKMIAVKFLGPNGGSLMDAIESVQYLNALRHKDIRVRASNNSWGGGGYYQQLSDAIRNEGPGISTDEKIMFIAAAGNNGSNNDSVAFYPANYNLGNVISVGAINSSGSMPSWSNYGATTVDLVAPGEGIVSTYLSWAGSYYTMSGTSMATPHVTGTIALLLTRFPGMTYIQIADTIKMCGIPLTSLYGRVASGRTLDAWSVVENNCYPYSGHPNPIGTQTPSFTPTFTPTPGPTNTPTPMPSPTATFTPTATPTPGYYGLEGTIYRASDGVGLGGVRVTIKYGSTTYTAYTDGTGHYSFTGLLGPVTYSIEAVLNGYSIDSTSIYLSSSRTVNLIAQANTHVLSGRVITNEMVPVAGATVTLNGPDRVVQTNAQGYFSFDVPLGMNYTLRTTAPDLVANLNDLHGTIYGNVQRVFVMKLD